MIFRWASYKQDGLRYLYKNFCTDKFSLMIEKRYTIYIYIYIITMQGNQIKRFLSNKVTRVHGFLVYGR